VWAPPVLREWGEVCARLSCGWLSGWLRESASQYRDCAVRMSTQSTLSLAYAAAAPPSQYYGHGTASRAIFIIPLSRLIAGAVQRFSVLYPRFVTEYRPASLQLRCPPVHHRLQQTEGEGSCPPSMGLVGHSRRSKPCRVRPVACRTHSAVRLFSHGHHSQHS
jgi:hypothetical protein